MEVTTPIVAYLQKNKTAGAGGFIFMMDGIYPSNRTGPGS